MIVHSREISSQSSHKDTLVGCLQWDDSPLTREKKQKKSVSVNKTPGGEAVPQDHDLGEDKVFS